jgi:hypothetical protein
MSVRLNRFIECIVFFVLLPGVITCAVRGSHVDIRVRLSIAGKLLNYTGIFLLLLGLIFIAERVSAAFTSGRVSQILQQQQDGHPCAAIGNAELQAECIKSAEDAAERGGR